MSASTANDDTSTLLVIGGAGYIGSTVVMNALASTSMNVVVLDKLMYGGDALFPFYSYRGRFTFVHGDVRTVNLDDLLSGVDFVFNAAALVGEHICKKFPDDALAINQTASIDVAKACERNGVKRYIFASTCSNYGKTTELVDESSPVAGLSLYSRTKIAVENFVLHEVPTLACTVLRFATVYGLASRVRFDLLVHELIRDAWVDKRMDVFGPDGWRPFVHVNDAARAVCTVCAHHLELPAKGVFNVGSNDQNFQKLTLATLVKQRLPATQIRVVKKGDPRSYRVNFGKFHNATGFKCLHRPSQTIDDICSALESGMISRKHLEECVNVAANDPIRQALPSSKL